MLQIEKKLDENGQLSLTIKGSGITLLTASFNTSGTSTEQVNQFVNDATKLAVTASTFHSAGVGVQRRILDMIE